jgi:hypothetical protein
VPAAIAVVGVAVALRSLRKRLAMTS